MCVFFIWDRKCLWLGFMLCPLPMLLANIDAIITSELKRSWTLLSGNWHFMATSNGHQSLGRSSTLNSGLIQLAAAFPLKSKLAVEMNKPFGGSVEYAKHVTTCHPQSHSCINGKFKDVPCIVFCSSWHCHILAGVPHHQRRRPMSN